MNNYNWFNNHEGELSFTVRHTEGDVETLIAVTDTAEKAHLIVTMLNNQLREDAVSAEELLKPYRRQSKNGVLDWVAHEDAVKVLNKELLQFLLLKQLYDGAIEQWKEADGEAGMLKKAVCTYDDMIKKFTEEIQRLKEVERDLEKQIELKELSNATLLLLNRDLEKWKEEAMVVMKDIPEIGKQMEVPLGQTIHDKILPYIKMMQDRWFPGAFLWWVHSNGWHKHSSGEYYYKSKDFHQWPPDEAKELDELKVEFKALYKL
jgi:hypothetical protein